MTRETSLPLSQYLNRVGNNFANHYMSYFNPQHSEAVRLRECIAALTPVLVQVAPKFHTATHPVQISASTSLELAAVTAAVRKKFKYAVDVYPIQTNLNGEIDVIAVRPHTSVIATALVAFNGMHKAYEVVSPRIWRARGMWRNLAWDEGKETLPKKLGNGDLEGWGQSAYQMCGEGRVANFVHKLPPYLPQEVAHGVVDNKAFPMRAVCTRTQTKIDALASMFNAPTVLWEMLEALADKQKTGRELTLPTNGYTMSKFMDYWQQRTELTERLLYEGTRKVVFALKMFGQEGVVCLYEVDHREFCIASYKSITDIPTQVQGALISLEIQEGADRWTGMVEGLGLILQGNDAARFCCEEVLGVTVEASVVDALLPQMTDRVRV